MKKVNFGLIFVFCISMISIGCTSKKGPVTYSRDDILSQREIDFPLNYSRTNFRKLLMGVAFESISGKDLETGKDLPISQDLSTRLQTEMAKLKRFTIFSAHNRGGVMFFQELADVDEDVQVASAENVRKMDIILSARVTVTKERHEGYRNNILIYAVECDVNCEDMRTHTVKFAEKAKGTSRREHLLTISGVRAAGYSEEDEQQAITEAAMDALANIANKLGNTYPVGGTISGISSTGERMQLDKGFEDGVGNKQQCVIYVDDGGIDIPLALAEASPGPNTANLRILRWNTRDDDAEPLIESLQAAPKEFLKQNKVYAAGYGMSVPPEWEHL